jgi:ubiquinone/menaquinone biosynthesis C-methylase UbiE
MKRVVTPEWLDSDSGNAEEIAASLADLQRVHRWFGGVRLFCRLVRTVAEEEHATELSLLDVAAGRADLPLEAARCLHRRCITLRVSALDRSPKHLQNATARDRIVGDALSLPFADGSFDLVSSSLFIHHLEPVEVRQFLGEALRVARRAVLIHDLRRHWLHWLLTYAGTPLYRSRLTRHDAPASVRRAYTAEEMAAMVASLPQIRRFISTKAYLFRMGFILFNHSKREAGTCA